MATIAYALDIKASYAYAGREDHGFVRTARQGAPLAPAMQSWHVIRRGAIATAP